MSFSTKGRYGLRAMFELALNYGKGPLPLSAISKEQDISLNYLEQLFLKLKKNNLVKSKRGAYGGYILTRNPNKIFVGEILRALEGSLAPIECLEEGKSCSKNNYCSSRVLFKKIDEATRKIIDSTTLEDMIEDYKNIDNE